MLAKKLRSISFLLLSLFVFESAIFADPNGKISAKQVASQPSWMVLGYRRGMNFLESYTREIWRFAQVVGTVAAVAAIVKYRSEIWNGMTSAGNTMRGWVHTTDNIGELLKIFNRDPGTLNEDELKRINGWTKIIFKNAIEAYSEAKPNNGPSSSSEPTFMEKIKLYFLNQDGTFTQHGANMLKHLEPMIQNLVNGVVKTSLETNDRLSRERYPNQQGDFRHPVQIIVSSLLEFANANENNAKFVAGLVNGLIETSLRTNDALSKANYPVLHSSPEVRHPVKIIVDTILAYLPQGRQEVYALITAGVGAAVDANNAGNVASSSSSQWGPTSIVGALAQHPSVVSAFAAAYFSDDASKREALGLPAKKS